MKSNARKVNKHIGEKSIRLIIKAISFNAIVNYTFLSNLYTGLSTHGCRRQNQRHPFQSKYYWDSSFNWVTIDILNRRLRRKIMYIKDKSRCRHPIKQKSAILKGVERVTQKMPSAPETAPKSWINVQKEVCHYGGMGSCQGKKTKNMKNTHRSGY